jgi:hypothetical protein
VVERGRGARGIGLGGHGVQCRGSRGVESVGTLGRCEHGRQGALRMVWCAARW